MTMPMDGARGELSTQTPLGLLSIVLRYRTLTIALPLLVAALLVVVGLVRPRSYSSSASFKPQNNSGSMSQLAGLAAQFGVAVPLDESGDSPDFYVDLLRSGQVLRQLVQTPFSVDGGNAPVDWLTYNQIQGSTPARRLEEGVRRVQRDLIVSTSLKTGVVGLTARARNPELAQQMAKRLIDLVNEFNLTTRQTQASQERRFVGERLNQVETELREAENSLQRFLQQNRQWRDSPSLAFEKERLERIVGMRQQVYTNLAQSFERARIDEVRNTPAITLVEQPILAARPDGRRLLLKGGLAFMLASSLAIVAALILEAMRRARAVHPEEAARLSLLGRQALAEVRMPWRMFKKH